MFRLRALVLALLIAPTALAQGVWHATSEPFEWYVWEIHITSEGTFLASTITGIYQSEDSARTWWKTLDDISNQFVENDGRVYAATDDGVYVSEDEGRTWTQTLPSAAKVVSADGSRILAGGRGGQVYLSEDTGTSWSVITCSQMPEGYDGAVNALTSLGDVVVYAHSLDGTFTSVPGGWSLDGDMLPALLLRREETLYGDSAGDLIQSVDGSTWSIAAETPLFAFQHFDVAGDTMVVAGFDGIAASADGGATWTDLTDTLEARSIYDVALDGEGFVYIGYNQQVLRSSAPVGSGSGTATKKLPVPEAHALLAPHPNPATGEVAVPVVVARPAAVDIELYDVAGRQLEVLLSRSMPAGTYRLIVDTARLPSGTYVIRLRAGAETDTRTITVAR